MNCAWCGEPATKTVEVEPAIYGSELDPKSGKNVKVMKRRAITAEVCPEHYEMVQRNRAEMEVRKAAERERRRKLREARAA